MIGEILAGVVLGNAVLGRIPAVANLVAGVRRPGNVLDVVYWMGLLLLMFLAGAETPPLFTREERRQVSWLTIVGAGLPFVAGLIFAPWIIGPALDGPNGNRISLTIVLAAGVAITSVPVVSKIFADLRILHTRFARLVLSAAVLEDMGLWLALAIATTTAGSDALHPRAMTVHLLPTVVFFVLGLTLLPRMAKRTGKWDFGMGARHSPVVYAICVLLAYCALAGALHVSLVLAAFLAGFAVAQKKSRTFGCAFDAIGQVAMAFFIPLYFAIVGLKLDLVHGVSFWMIVPFIAGTCIVKVLSVSMAGRLAGFRGLDPVNLAIAANARGGAGVVLASVAFDAGIVSPKFYTTLVVAAVVTSQMAGAWLERVLCSGRPLLTPVAAEATFDATEEDAAA